jgi:hypothetical protein
MNTTLKPEGSFLVCCFSLTQLCVDVVCMIGICRVALLVLDAMTLEQGRQ